MSSETYQQWRDGFGGAAELERLRAENERLKDENRREQDARLGLESSLSRLETELTALRRPLAEIRKEAEGEEGIGPQQMLDYLCRRIDALQKTTRKLQPENERMRRELQECSESIAKWTARAIELGKQIDELRRPLEQSAGVEAIRARHKSDQVLREKAGSLVHFRTVADEFHADRGALLSALDTTARQLRERVEMLEAANREIDDLRCPADCEDDRNPCNVCGTPVRYGERHTKCGESVMALEKEIARLSSPPQERQMEVVDEIRDRVRRNLMTNNAHLTHVELLLQAIDILLADCAAYRNALSIANTTIAGLRERLERELLCMEAGRDSALDLCVRKDDRIERLEGALRGILDSACSVPAPYIGNPMDPVNDLRIVSGRKIEAARTALAASQQHTPARTPEQYAIEHGRYLATAAQLFMDACNALFSAEQELEKTEPDTQEQVDDLISKAERAQEIRGERWRGLERAIYEFTKRADRAYPLKQHTAGSGGGSFLGMNVVVDPSMPADQFEIRSGVNSVRVTNVGSGDGVAGDGT